MNEDRLIADQVDYYRAIAGEYEDHYIDASDSRDELLRAFDDFGIHGEVLELASGPGQWTEKLIARAASVTAVDASPEMIRRAQARVGDGSVRFIEADLFSWQPDRRYDCVFVGFWLSHVPERRFDAFWALLADCLQPDGRVFLVDDNHRTDSELIEGPDSEVIERHLNDGTSFRVIKVPHRASDLEARLSALGWDAEMSASGPLYWGTCILRTTPPDAALPRH